MVTFISERLRVSVPGWVTDIDAFRRWRDADDFPDDANVWWLKGEVWMDFSSQQVFTHVAVKTEVLSVLNGLADREQLGMYLTSGALLSNLAADICGTPDGLFLSNQTLASGRVLFLKDQEGGFNELQGSPDMVLEILSKSSEEKDTVTLMQGYWEAEVREYWLMDARQDPPVFEIYRHGAKGYTRTRKQAGWVRSNVFDKSFRLSSRLGLLEQPDYALELR